jgi:hypothetical protein
LVAGGLDGVGHPVVLTGLPDDRVAVVLPGVVDSHPHPERQGGLAITDCLASVVAALVGGDAVVGVEPVEGLLGAADGVALEVGVGVTELVGQASVVVAVAGVKVAAEAAGDLVNRPVAELVTAEGGRGLQVLQQLPPVVEAMAVGIWWSGVRGV